MTEPEPTPEPVPDPMRGTRVPWTGRILAPGEYCKLPDGSWHGETPNGHGANFGNHTVTEHDDGTITVSPSIKVSAETELWHGFLERGVWRSC